MTPMSPGRGERSLALLVNELEGKQLFGEVGSLLVSQITYDSRAVIEGGLFCAMVGERSDGHLFARQAVANGAVAVVAEHHIDDIDDGVVQIVLGPGKVRPAMAQLACAFYGHPSRFLTMIGVTGTNGKTTVTNLVATIVRKSGRKAHVIGTLSGARTTPEAPDLQAHLAEIVSQQGPTERTVVAMEVTSHALVLDRVNGIHFDVAVFTNLSHDHLDFHRTMNDYFEAKATLFLPERCANAVINIDDQWGKRLVERVRVPVVRVEAEHVSQLKLFADHTQFSWRERSVTLPLVGAINAGNAVVAAEVARLIDIDTDAIVEGLKSVATVPGRLEFVPAHCTALVDYAHTPAALAVAIEEARRIAQQRDGKVIVVFGCGGNRDDAKRPLMGEVASRLSDLVIITTDNPRTEDPIQIATQIASGAKSDVIVELDRRQAIAFALHHAGANDVLVVAGKGHEVTQEVAGVRYPFDDRVVIKEVDTSEGEY